MKIRITGGDHDLNLTLPTKLLLNRYAVKLVCKSDKLSGKLEGIPEEAMVRLVAELDQIRKKYGAWELVEVTSADGEIVKITL